MRNSKENMAHLYFYEGVANGECKRYSGQTLSFNRDCAVSYSTTVGIVVPRKGYEKANPHLPESGLLILSYDSMSSYTGRDIAAFRSASPFEHAYAIFERGETYYDPKVMRDRLLWRLTELEKDLHHAESRRKFLDLMQNRAEIVSKTCDKWAKPLQSKKLFAKYEKIAADMEGYAKALKNRRRNETAKREARKRAFLKKYAGASGASYNALLMSVYGDIEKENPLGFTAKRRQEAREHLGGQAAYYVWLSGDEVRTNHAIRIPVQEVRIALKAWAAGKDMRCTRVGNYSVVSYQGDTIQIGCHKFTRRNLLALYEVVVGKPFPVLKEQEARCGR